MLDFSFLDRDSLRLIYILVLSLTIWAVFQLFSRSIAKSFSGTARGKRLRTLTSVIRAVVSTLIIGFAIFESLSVVGVNLAPLIASAGVVGLAIGFGAQTLVKDVISGFFLLLEDQFDEGDEIEIAGKRGVVKKISLRTIWLEEENGSLHIIPNGTITVVSNFSNVKQPEKKEKLLAKK